MKPKLCYPLLTVINCVTGSILQSAHLFGFPCFYKGSKTDSEDAGGEAGNLYLCKASMKHQQNNPLSSGISQRILTFSCASSIQETFRLPLLPVEPISNTETFLWEA